jgi:hypothetical protein
MDIKPRPNHSRYLEILRSMSPDKKLQKVFELNALAKALRMERLRGDHPEMTEHELSKLYVNEILRCHNRSC